MIGVVLWSDAIGGKAVFWCEDQGDLAYYEDQAINACHIDTFFETGDMVQFDVSLEHRLRRASNAMILKEQAWSGLSDTLRKNDAVPEVGSENGNSAKIIPFSIHATATEETRAARKA